jgi:hypothetical protein
MKELVYTQRTNDRRALLQRMLDNKHDIWNNFHILVNVTTSTGAAAAQAV